MRTYEPLPGDHIKGACEKLVALANLGGEPATMQFNDQTITAGFDTDPQELVDAYQAECTRRAEAWRGSPEGQKAAMAAEAFRKQAEASAAEGIKPFSIINQAGWEECVLKNADPYGACVVRYAARWAHLMEQAMRHGKPLKAVADATSHAADTEGITGFMFGCAVSILSQVWEHGAALKEWRGK